MVLMYLFARIRRLCRSSMCQSSLDPTIQSTRLKNVTSCATHPSFVPRGVVANVLDCDIVVSEFKLPSRNYVCFRTNTLGKVMNPFNVPPAALG